jgi:hypothetical protein
MDAALSGHPTPEVLKSFILCKLDNTLAKSVENHLERCHGCRKLVADISADSFLVGLRDAQERGRAANGRPDHDESRDSERASEATPVPAHTLPPGLANHPDYQIKGKLGRGSMGVGYLVHNRLMRWDEVVKVMGREIVEEPGVLDRFLREIRPVARLRHPNIVSAYTAFRCADGLVFAMEYVAGLDLALVRRRPFVGGIQGNGGRPRRVPKQQSNGLARPRLERTLRRRVRGSPARGSGRYRL